MEKIDLTHQLVAQGYGYDELARLVRAGELVHVRRGAYAAPPTAELDDRQAHLRLITATAAQCGLDAALSHDSAAAVLGLPLWTDRLSRTHLTTARPAGGGRIRGPVHLHPTPIDEAEIRSVAGLRVTSPARTVIDLARGLPETRSVPIGDAALHDELTTPVELSAALTRAKGWPGIARARRVVATLNPLSQSVGESYSRVVMERNGVPSPVLQRDVYNESGEFVG